MQLCRVVQGAQSQRLAALLLIIIFGLMLRRFGYSVGLPFVVVKYGGSLLWGSMVYFLLASAVAGFVTKVRPPGIAAMATVVAICVELFRLYHSPWLDAFRLTTAGALLLGRVFSLWNILAYAIGIAAAYALDPVHRKSSPSRP